MKAIHLGIAGAIGWLLLAPKRAVAAVSGGAKPPAKPDGTPTMPSSSKPSPAVPTVYEGELSDLSNDPVKRSAQIRQMIMGGKFDGAQWHRLETSDGPRRARLYVSPRALTIDGVRVSMTERDQQKVADYLSAHLLTPFLVDRILASADVVVPAKPQQWWKDNTMGNAKRVFDYDAIVSAEMGNVPADKLVANEGKDWVLDAYAFSSSGASTGTNYGWFMNGKPLQPIGHVHNLDHTDYSQLSRFVFSGAEVSEDNGETWRSSSFEEIVTSPELYRLASAQKLPAARHPGVGGLI